MYEVGSHIDLHYINKKKDSASAPKKTFEQKAQNLYFVGTQFIFRFTPAGVQTAIKIPAAMA